MNNQTQHIILIHGLHQKHWIMKKLAKFFEKKGYISHCFNYKSITQPMTTHIQRLDKWISSEVGADNFHIVAHSLGGLIAREFIHHYPHWHDNQQLQRVVTLGTPHNGSVTADYSKRLLPFMIGKAYQGGLDGKTAQLKDGVCLGVIAGNKPHGLGQPFLSYHSRKVNKYKDSNFKDSNLKDYTHDGTVYLSETQLTNCTDHVVMKVTHTGMLFDINVAKQALYFLENGLFNHS